MNRVLNVLSSTERQARWFFATRQNGVEHAHVMLVVLRDIRCQNRITGHVNVVEPVYKSGEIVDILKR